MFSIRSFYVNETKTAARTASHPQGPSEGVAQWEAPALPHWHCPWHCGIQQCRAAQHPQVRGKKQDRKCVQTVRFHGLGGSRGILRKTSTDN